MWILLLIGIGHFALSQTLKTFKGTVDYKFNLSSTNKITPNERKELENGITPYVKKMELLISYYTALYKGDNKVAKEVLSHDTLFSKDDAFTLAYMFSLARMKQLGVLYKPCIQVNDNGEELKIIVCTEQQQKEFIEHGNSKTYDLKCNYVGSLIKDNIQIYKLISYR